MCKATPLKKHYSLDIVLGDKPNEGHMRELEGKRIVITTYELFWEIHMIDGDTFQLH